MSMYLSEFPKDLELDTLNIIAFYCRYVKYIHKNIDLIYYLC